MQKGTQGLEIKQGDDKNTGDRYRQKGDRCIGTESVQPTGQATNRVVWLQTHYEKKKAVETETREEVRVRAKLGQTKLQRGKERSRTMEIGGV